MSRPATPPARGVSARRRLLAAAVAPVAIAAPVGAAIAAPGTDEPTADQLRSVLEMEVPSPTIPTFEIDPGALPGLPDDLTTPAPIDCTEYDHGRFDVAVERYDDELIEVRLSYDDPDVCEFAVWLSFWDADDVAAGAAWSDIVGLDTIAAATDSAGYHQITIDDRDFCNWEVRVAVEEGLPESYPGSEDCEPEPAGPPASDPPAEPEPPAGTESASDSDEPGDDHGSATPGTDGSADPGAPADPVVPAAVLPDGAAESTSAGATATTPDHAAAHETTASSPTELLSESAGSPSGRGTDGTKLLLGLGFLVLGFGSIAALLTRPRRHLPAA